MNAILNIDSENELNEVVKNEKVILDFYAEWCGPCKLLKVQLEQLNAELGGSVKIVKVNVDNNPELARKYNLMSVPTMIFYEKGKIVNKISGFRPKEEIKGILYNL